MSEPKIRLQYLYTDYTHFGPHAGPRLLIDYIDRDAFSVGETAVKKEKGQHGLPFLAARKLTRKHFTRHGMLLYYLEDYLAERSVAEQAAADPVDIVHYIDGDHSHQHLRQLLDARGQQQTKIIATHHQPPDRLERMVAKEPIKHLDHVFLVSPEQVPFFQQYLPDEKISVVELGVSAQFYVPAPTPPSDEVFRTITVGSHMRDFDTLRATAKKMESEAMEFHVVSRSLENDPAYPNVIVHQGISDDELLALYQQTHVLLLTLSDTTANSALLEGMACRIAIATNDLVGTRHYLPDDDRFFLPDHNPDHIVQHLHRLMEDADLRKELASKAHARAQELAWPNVARRCAEIYRRVLGR